MKPLARPPESVAGVLAAIDREPEIIRCLRLAERLASLASGHVTASSWLRLAEAAQSDDAVVAIAAIHGLGASRAPQSVAVLARILETGPVWGKEHAAWALWRHSLSPQTTDLLLDMVAEGGFTGMLAQRTLQRQLGAPGPGIEQEVTAALPRIVDSVVRGRLVQMLGLDPRRGVVPVLERIARDADEDRAVRAEAIAGLGARGGARARGTLEKLVADGPLATDALLALADAARTPPRASDRADALRIAQIFLHADLDAGLQNAGVGDNGGIASLLVLLAEALGRQPGVEMILTLSRGQATDALTGTLWPRDDRSVFAAVPFPQVEMGDAWEHRILAERGIRRQLRARAPVHAFHLRMADVGSLAAASVAASLEIPVVFTAAPDPHGVIEALQHQGALRREHFGHEDHAAHWWFRARLVERLTRSAHTIALLPRPDVRRAVSNYFGIDRDRLDERSAVIPEGVHAPTIEQAHREAAGFIPGGGPAVLADLRARRDALPKHRVGLPLMVSVGRLHAGKGVDRVVEAWLGAEDLRGAYNLVIVGGDLDDPSPGERAVLDAIDAVLDGRSAAENGLILFGHRPHLDSARVLASAALGGGIYVCGSAKEEFGLAVVEALAAGLVPVAPREGGPPTYLNDGVDGVLVSGGRVDALRDGMRRARLLVHVPGRAEAARARVERDLSIERMAEALCDLYRRAGISQAPVPQGAA